MVFGFFSKERALQRTIKKATNKLAQSADRWAAMEKLRDDGSDEALFALLQRFSFSSLKSIEDQQEKDWVVEAMIGKGEAGLPALQRFLISQANIAYPLQILQAVTTPERVLKVIDELLAVEEPGYTRDPDKRIQIIHWLTEWQECTDRQAAERVAPYLADFDESVRFAAAESVATRPDPCAAEAMVTALINPEEESGRLKARIAETMVDAGLSLCGQKKAVQSIIDELFTGELRIQKDLLVRKKKGKK